MRLTIYSKPGCHLCDVMKDVVHRVVGERRGEISVEEIDISGSAELQDLYGMDIPVLAIDGRKVAKYKITDGELRRMLAAR